MRSDAHMDLRTCPGKYENWNECECQIECLAVFFCPFAYALRLGFCERVRLYLYKKVMQLTSPQFT